MLASYKKSLHAAFMVVFYLALGLQAYAQSGGNSGIHQRHRAGPFRRRRAQCNR